MSNGRANLGGEAYRQRANSEPLPGYVLLDPLGRGGFGEVWKCEAPGGLHKAIKFVYPDSDADDAPGDSLRQEYEAFQHIKTIRHPFLLMLERVELIDGVLASVMELADEGLADRYAECQRLGLKGIPRAELLGYLTDAAEALDVIAVKHGLQHLDIKPANLFLVGGHVKVGDYGLVSRSNPKASRHGAGFTPRYAPPELIDGRVDPRSDQYSLALVYFEMLTGGFPFAATSAKDLMMAHAALDPDLTALPVGDRPAVQRALAKDPDDRFPNCLGLLRALLSAGPPPPSDVTLRQARMGQQQPMPIGRPGPAPSAAQLLGAAAGITRSRIPAPGAATGTPTLALRTPGQSGIAGGVLGMPRLTTPAARPAGETPPPAARPQPAPAAQPAVGFDTPRPKAADQPTATGSEPVISLTPAPPAGPVHRLANGFQAVLPVPLLTGGIWPGADPADRGRLRRHPVRVGLRPRAAAGGRLRPDPPAGRHLGLPVPGQAHPGHGAVQAAGGVRGVGRHPGPPRPVPVPAAAGAGQGAGELAQPGREGRAGGRAGVAPAGAGQRRRAHHRPAVRPGRRVTTAQGQRRVAEGADRPTEAVPEPAGPSEVAAGAVHRPAGPLPGGRGRGGVPGRGRRGVDVSPTGLCCQPAGPMHSRYVYVEFPRVPGVAGLAVLVEMLRRSKQPDGEPVAGMYRVDLDAPVDAMRSNPDVRASCY